MFNRFCLVLIFSCITASFSFAHTVTFKSLKGDGIKLNGTYTLMKKNGVDISSDGKLSLIKLKRFRNKSARGDAYIYDALDKMTFNGASYKVHFVSMTEKDGTAFGIFKIFNAAGTDMDSGNYTYVSTVKPTKTGQL